MSALAIFLVISGIIILLAGYIPANKICRKIKHVGWQVLSYLIIGFVVGYTFVLGSIFANPDVTPVLFSLCIILFSGSVFVYMVTTYSLQSIEQLHLLADEEKHNALHDSLTALPNRKHCIETIELLIESDKPFDLMLLDIVNFKQVNDGMGHFCGDQLLIQIGQRISSLLKRKTLLLVLVVMNLSSYALIVMKPAQKHSQRRLTSNCANHSPLTDLNLVQVPS